MLTADRSELSESRDVSKRKKGPSFFRRCLKYFLIALAVLFLLTVAEVGLFRYVNPPFTATMAWQSIKKGKPPRKASFRDFWRPLRDISPHLRRAVLAGEDQRFLSHWGFDFVEMNQAIKDMAMSRGMRGASTITMQAARTVFLWPERTLMRKVVEAYYTCLLEFLWSKERILEIYLNTVDWGRGHRGAQEAARAYFDTSSSGLTRSQAALLVAILPNPGLWSPRHPSERVTRRQERILRDMDTMPLL
jgi:monofunctional biosynthetic peptidoglycan transglycosylase